MVTHWIEEHKPAAAARTHLVLAAGMWSVVGAAMLTVGTHWALRPAESASVLALAAAFAIGVLKSGLLLDRTARRIAGRIERRGDGRCVGGFLSARSWALVAVMVAAGRVLRSGVLSHHVVGLLYAAIGTALLLSSRLLWRRWIDIAS